MIAPRRDLLPWERLAALVATAVALALNVAASIQLFVPQSTFGYHLIYTNGFEVAAVDPGTSAARAGIAVGDHLDFTKSNLHDRIVGLSYQPALPGEAVTFSVVHEGRARPLTLRAGLLTVSESRRAIFSPLASFLRLTGFAYIAVALIILFRRPSRMTWGLFLYLVSATSVALYRFPDSLFPFAQFASDVLDVAGPIGLIVFAARFPDDAPTGWHATLDRLAIPVGAIFAIPNLAWDATSLYFGVSPSPWMSYGSTLGALALILVAGMTLALTYLRAAAWERRRFQWVVAGILLTLLSYASDWARYWATTYRLATSDPLVWTGTILYACAPFAIAYAVVRQRVFEISFVISRTLVLATLTAVIFALFALIEWLAGRVIEHSGVTIALVAVAAIGVAFSLNALHARVEQFVESTLFRRRREAERHLADIAAGLPFAGNAAAVESALVHEPIAAYALSSADLFLRTGSGDYARNGMALDPSIPLRLQGRRRALRLHDGTLVLAVPVFVRSRLEAVAVYGAHVSGEDIDPSEASSLEAMGVAAGLACDHLQASRLDRDLTRWRNLAERQAREIAALRERISLLGEHLAGDDAHGNGPM